MCKSLTFGVIYAVDVNSCMYAAFIFNPFAYSVEQ